MSKLYKTKFLLSESNAKTIKNGMRTKIMYLAPHKLANGKVNLCPNASKGCIESCLNTAGRGVMSNVSEGRINKTLWFIHDKVDFLTKLIKELSNFNKLMGRKKTIGLVRLNGTSDLDFAAIIKNKLGVDILSYKNLKYYDYTKNLDRAIKVAKSNINYTLTYSWNEESDKDLVIAAMKQGVNVAIVFRNELPDTWHGFKVIDGDKADDLMLYNKSVVLGLKAKGKAKKDNSGFVLE